ncbi:MAG: prepilin-type N-terminal cleavage/methylation domain-containing protein [Campylobacterales bacterium]|nr:prepilin-type N-terminal cleavage/methylation domain-containing protein [Campylobacterales bacterium]
MTRQRKGFTLVELSIVLIIIGLIIGGVLKGTDLINGAKQKKVYTTWIKGWQVAINTYQDRTGQLLGDGAANGGAAGAANGTFDDIDLSTAAGTTLANRLRAVGLDIPVTNTAAAQNGGSYTIDGKYATSTSIMTLSGAILINGLPRNILSLTLVPTDVAMALDTMIDGTADAGLGNCVRSTAVAGAAPATAVWPAANVAATKTVTVYIIL